MDDEITLELDGTAYHFDGRGWSCLDDHLAPLRAVAARLSAMRDDLLRRAEAEAFARALAEARSENRPPRVLVTGARTWTDAEAVRRELAVLPAHSVVIHGDANGADRLAEAAAVELGHEVIACPASWARYGKAAGLRRNEAMLREHRPDVVIAFHPALEQSKGTRHMVRIARAAGVPVRVVSG
jgi:hypothetical protein